MSNQEPKTVMEVFENLWDRAISEAYREHPDWYRNFIDQALFDIEKIIVPEKLKINENVLLPAHINEKTDGIYAYTLGFIEGNNLTIEDIKARIRQ